MSSTGTIKWLNEKVFILIELKRLSNDKYIQYDICQRRKNCIFHILWKFLGRLLPASWFMGRSTSWRMRSFIHRTGVKTVGESQIFPALDRSRWIITPWITMSSARTGALWPSAVRSIGRPWVIEYTRNTDWPSTSAATTSPGRGSTAFSRTATSPCRRPIDRMASSGTRRAKLRAWWRHRSCTDSSDTCTQPRERVGAARGDVLTVEMDMRPLLNSPRKIASRIWSYKHVHDGNVITWSVGQSSSRW